MTAFQDVAAFIGGATRPEVDMIFDLCKQRTKTLYAVASATNLATLQPGDIVVIDGISPKYLNGARATVKANGRKAGRLSVQLVEAVGRFSSLYPIEVPASCLTKTA